MTITLIGTGNVGGSLTRRWATAGYTLRLGVRDLSDPQALALAAEYPNQITLHALAEAANGADAVVFAVPAGAAFSAAQAVGGVGQAVVIDAMNALFTKPEPYERTSAALMAGTGSQRVVKCFNWTGAENMLDPLYGDERADMLYCSDDPEARPLHTSWPRRAAFAPSTRAASASSQPSNRRPCSGSSFRRRWVVDLPSASCSGNRALGFIFN